MTDTTTIDEPAPGGEVLEPLHESAALGAEGRGADDRVKSRYLLPILVPALSMAAVALYVLNVSRVFLAGDKDAALVIGIIVTLSILIGASIIAAAPRLRTSSLVVIMALVVLIVVGAGAVALGPSVNEKETAAGNGLVGVAGTANSTVTVTAGPGLTFNGVASTGNYPATGPIVSIAYKGDSGHTLAIDDPKYQGFLLGTDSSAKHTEQVKLAPGTYTIYCTVPGHRAAGMQATITVK